MLSLKKDITNNRTGHVNQCWVAKCVDSIDLIGGTARIRYFGYKDAESFKAGKEEEEIKVVTRRVDDYSKFEELFTQVMMTELVREGGEFEGAEVVNIITKDDIEEIESSSETEEESSSESSSETSSESSSKTE